MNVQIEESWKARLEPEFEKDYFHTLTDFVREEYSHYPIYPPGKLIFNAFNLCPFDKVKVVIIGQDPYHNVGQAHGLSFSVKPGVDIPPSLANIYQELHDDLGCYIPNNGYLVKWAEQGVLMLNAVLTVRAHQANSHQGHGWEQCTKKSFDVKQSESSDLKSSASKSVICLSWFLGKQAFQQNEQLPDRARC